MTELERARDTYNAFRGRAFRPHQDEAIEHILMSGSKIPVVVGPCGCLSEETIIRYNRATLGRKETIGNLYRSFKGIRKGTKTWDKDIKTYVRSFNGSSVQLHEATEFIYSGFRFVVRLELEDGKTLRATPEHLVLTSNGWKEIIYLSSEDYVVCDTPKPTKSLTKQKKKNDTWCCNLWMHPYARKIKTAKEKRGYTKSIEIHRAIYESYINDITLDEYKRILRDEQSNEWENLKYIDPNIFHIHHKDENHYNNNPTNLACMGKSDHLRLHGKFENFGQGLPVFIRVKSVEGGGYAHVYDITSSDYSNFIANGIVVHNSGKSCIGMVSGELSKTEEKNKFLYLCSSKMLQNQLVHDFPEAKLMKGRNNYKCIRFDGLDCSQCTHTNKKPCNHKGSCHYEVQKKAVLGHDKQILNYVYSITESMHIGKFTNYPLVICDEGDTVENVLSGVVGMNFNIQHMIHYGIKAPRYSSFNASGSDQAWQEWCTHGLDVMKRHISKQEALLGVAVEGSEDHISLVKDLNRMQDVYGKIKLFGESYDENWIVDKRKDRYGKVVSWNLKPVWLTREITEKLLLKNGDKFAFMSATFPEEHVLAELLGLEPGDFDIFEVPSLFPVENRKIYLRPVANLNSGGEGISYNAVFNIQKEISSLLERYRNVKGVVHTVSWWLNNKIMELGNSRLITHDQYNKTEMLKLHYDSPEPTVFVSPSSMRGVDMKGDRGRFNIIVKCPWPNLGDKLVSTRVYGNKRIGRLWFANQAAMSITQAIGRVVRDIDDWGDTWIIDESAVNLMLNQSRLFPNYILEARTW
jgi:hypothetical protein